MKVKSLSPVRILAIPWTAAYQAPPSTGFSRQEYWSGVPLPSPQQGPSATLIHKRLKHTCQNGNGFSARLPASSDLSSIQGFSFPVQEDKKLDYLESQNNHRKLLDEHRIETKWIV